jgi:hypothetical protein
MAQRRAQDHAPSTARRPADREEIGGVVEVALERDQRPSDRLDELRIARHLAEHRLDLGVVGVERVHDAPNRSSGLDAQVATAGASSCGRGYAAVSISSMR